MGTPPPPGKGEQVFILTRPVDGEFGEIKPSIVETLWGVDIRRSKEVRSGSSGSHVTNSQGSVIGIHKSCNLRMYCDVAISYTNGSYQP